MNDRVPSEKLMSVQAMRGIAALLVVLFHLEAMFREGAPRSREFGEFWARGFAGVDMFFVISGFIMVYVTRDIAPSLKNAGRFLWARVSRIYPLWWVFAFFMMIYFYTAYGQPAPPDKASGDGVLPYVVKSLLLLPQKFDPVLGLGWTLIHEMLFYILFTLGLLLPRKFLRFWLGGWAALIVAAGLLTPPQPIHAENAGQLIFSPINLEFVLGAFVGLLLIDDKMKSSALPANQYTFNWARVAAYGVPSAMIIFGAVWMEREKGLSIPSALSHLGNWSYSLYLSHLLVLLSLKRVWNMQALQDYIPSALKWGAPGWLDNVVYIIIGLAASIIFAAISYRLIERPSLRLLRGKSHLS